MTPDVRQRDFLLKGVLITILPWEEPLDTPPLIAVQARRSDLTSFSASMILSLSLVDFCWRYLNWVLFLTLIAASVVVTQ